MVSGSLNFGFTLSLIEEKCTLLTHDANSPDIFLTAGVSIPISRARKLTGNGIVTPNISRLMITVKCPLMFIANQKHEKNDT